VEDEMVVLAAAGGGGGGGGGGSADDVTTQFLPIWVLKVCKCLLLKQTSREFHQCRRSLGNGLLVFQ
jgi:hypothetical protein